MKVINYKLHLFVTIILALSLLVGCEEKRKALVAAHNSVGELLLSTQQEAKALRDNKVITPETYKLIGTNWVRAQTSYIKASDMLEYILSANSYNIDTYLELITQVNLILSDISLWLEEEKHEPSTDRIVSNPTPTPYNTPDSRGDQDTGIERRGQGVIKESSKGDEGKGGVGNMDRLKIPNDNNISKITTLYTTEYIKEQEIKLFGFPGNTKEVKIHVNKGSLIHDNIVFVQGLDIVMTLEEAKEFKARSGENGTVITITGTEKE